MWLGAAVLLFSAAGGVQVGLQDGPGQGVELFVGLSLTLGFVVLSVGVTHALVDGAIDWAIAEHPLAMATLGTVVTIPVVGAALAGLFESLGFSLAQDTEVFATLAQLVVTLLIAFAIEAAAFRIGGDMSARERREMAVAVGGIAGGAAIGLLAAIWGLVHPQPGLVFVGMSVSAILVLVTILVLLPVMRILDEDPVPLE